MTHHRQAKIAAKKRSPFNPHRGLAAPDLFLDIMLDQRTWKACSIDCRESLGNIYGTDPKHVTRRVKHTKMLSWENIFIPSRLSTRWSTKSSVGVNPQGRSVERVRWPPPGGATTVVMACSLLLRPLPWREG
jgi:hypothetical protein